MKALLGLVALFGLSSCAVEVVDTPRVHGVIKYETGHFKGRYSTPVVRPVCEPHRVYRPYRYYPHCHGRPYSYPYPLFELRHRF